MATNLVPFKLLLDSLKQYDVKSFVINFELWEEVSDELRYGGARVTGLQTNSGPVEFPNLSGYAKTVEQFLVQYSNQAYPNLEPNQLYRGEWTFDLTTTPYSLDGSLEKEIDIEPQTKVCFTDLTRSVTVLTDGAEVKTN